MFDEWPDEPDEERPEDRWGDPEARWGNPEEDLVSVPEAPSYDDADVDPELSAFWWRTVVLANVALGGVTVGPMVIFFERMWLVGGGAFLVGALALLRVYQHVRWFQDRDEGDADDGDDAPLGRNA